MVQTDTDIIADAQRALVEARQAEKQAQALRARANERRADLVQSQEALDEAARAVDAAVQRITDAKRFVRDQVVAEQAEERAEHRRHILVALALISDHAAHLQRLDEAARSRGVVHPDDGTGEQVGGLARHLHFVAMNKAPQ